MIIYRVLLMINFTVMWVGPAALAGYCEWTARQPDLSPDLRWACRVVQGLMLVLGLLGFTMWLWWLLS